MPEEYEDEINETANVEAQETDDVGEERITILSIDTRGRKRNIELAAGTTVKQYMQEAQVNRVVVNGNAIRLDEPIDFELTSGDKVTIPDDLEGN